MSLVVFLRGVNVGGHKAFRPTLLANQMKHLAMVNIGAAGTFVVRRSVGKAQLRAELTAKLPFDAAIAICQGRDIVRMISQNPFLHQPTKPDIVPFVSVMCGRPSLEPSLPLELPARGRWMLRIVGRERHFIFGIYRRQMKAIDYLNKVDRLFGTPVTTRNWNTIATVAKVLADGVT